MGGGTDTDEAFLWQIKNANGGDFVVLRASGDDAYNPWVMNMSVVAGAKLNSVTTILFKNSKASAEAEVLTAIRNAEAIFLAGGDQSQYLDYWVGTDVQKIIQDKLKTVTIGGTSAGCMVLGNWIYSAESGSVTSEEALANPYDKYITIAPGLLKIPYLETLLADTHFVTRTRMGRMVTFMARILKDSSTPPVSSAKAVGIDEHTALLLDVNTGDVSAVGVGTAYICSSDHNAQVCKDKTYLTFQDVQCTRLSGKNGDKYSFATFKGQGVNYVNNVVAGVFTGNPYGPV